ncbi:MAG: TPM domain-containing protein [Bacteroidia bacterium]|nr:TPM domain-containing protein [Bacteroidia bacterium]
MSKLEAFLTPLEEQEIVQAILTAEKNTSGEIRVHIECELHNNDISKRTLELFHKLKMDNTKLQNGVLIYVAIDDKVFSIYGDKGINDVVGLDFWKSTKDIMASHFKKGEFKDGIVNGILKTGEQLHKYFPYQSDDIDELSNEISKG